MLKKFSITVLLFLLITACSTETISDTPLPSPSSENFNQAEPIIEEDTAESRGQALFVQSIDDVGFACASCHYLTSARLIGPGMGNIAEQFEGYDLDMTLEEYLIQSIIAPTAYLVEASPQYPANVMPTTYADLFDEAQIDDLVQYILSL